MVGSFVIYILEWALCLSAFLLLYKMCFSGSTFHRFNRLFLLGSVVVAALLPLIHITTSEEMEPIAEVCRLNTEGLAPISEAPLLSPSKVDDMKPVIKEDIKLSPFKGDRGEGLRDWFQLFRVQTTHLCDGFHLFAGGDVNHRQQSSYDHTAQEE